MCRGASLRMIPLELTAAIEALIPEGRSPRRLFVYGTTAMYEYYLAADGTVFEHDLDSMRSAEPVESKSTVHEVYVEAARKYPTLAALATIDPAEITLPTGTRRPHAVPEPTTDDRQHSQLERPSIARDIVRAAPGTAFVDDRGERPPITLDDAIATPGVVAAWDRGDSSNKTLRIFATGVTGARELLSVQVEATERAALLERISSRGVRIGACDNNCRYVWAADPNGFELWDESMLILWVVRGGIELAGRRWVVEHIARVESFAHAEVIADHGVRLIYDDGTPLVVVAHTPTVTRPAWDPFIGGWAEEELAGGWLWTRFLAQDLAASLRVPYAHVEPR